MVKSVENFIIIILSILLSELILGSPIAIFIVGYLSKHSERFYLHKNWLVGQSIVQILDDVDIWTARNLM